MAEKRVSVRLAAVGGRQVRAELEGIGEAGKRGFGRLSSEMEAANARLAAFSRRVTIAMAAAVTAAAAAGVAMIRSGLATIDAQAKLAQSLGTTVASIQVLERAGELAGVAMSGIEQATKDLTRRLSQAASGAGPAAEALGPTRALGLRAAGAASGRAGRPHQPGDRRLRARSQSAPRSPASSSARKAASPCRASTPRRCARRRRTCATSAWWSPRRTPTKSSGPTTRSPGSG